MPVVKGKEIPPPPAKCPKCGYDVFGVLLFMAIEPDGYVCQKCGTLISFEGNPLGTVLSAEEEQHGTDC